jgi:hypothetical protein
MKHFAAATLCAAAALAGCKPMSPRPAAAPPPPPQPVAQDPKSDPGIMQIPEGGSNSALGKARDAAVRTKGRIQQYQDEVAKQADEVFKNP